MQAMDKGTKDGLRELWVEVGVGWGFDINDVSDEDREAIGSHTFLVPADLEDKTAAALAMGIFHSTVPVEHLGVLAFEVRDAAGVELLPARDIDWYELARRYEGQLWRAAPALA